MSWWRVYTREFQATLWSGGGLSSTLWVDSPLKPPALCKSSPSLSLSVAVCN